MRQFWHCAAAWMAPPAPACDESGEGDRAAEQHTQTAGHPTITTTRADWAPVGIGAR